MSDFYALHPFLPGARRLLPQDLSLDLVPEMLLGSASRRLRNILSKQPDYSVVLSPREEVFQYVLMRLFLSVLGNEYYYDRFAMYYAERTRLHSNPDDFLAEVGVDPEYLSVAEYMRFKHIYPETKLYHLPVANGRVFFPRRLVPYLAGTVAYTMVRGALPAEVSGLPDVFKRYAQAAIPVTVSRTGGKGWGFIERILSASGIPDGKKRIILYWIMPYLVTVRGLSVDEAVSRVQEWLANQGGQKVLLSWVRADAENVKKRGVRPWSIKTVEQRDPALVKMLREMGVL
ncbi:MAG: DNA primase noncatalytic subunit PriX [Candidatus Diapherotrites archaeon]|nr:DNA primase noncatalytic subunit PriX [Candidatus Diapherotrites archaeon]